MRIISKLMAKEILLHHIENNSGEIRSAKMNNQNINAKIKF